MSDGARRIRVLWLIKSLGLGGAERLLVNHARIRDAERFDYSVAYIVDSGPSGDLRDELVALGIPVRRLGKSNSSLNPMWLVDLWLLLHRERFDIVHIHSPLVAALARLIIMVNRGLKIVYTEHNRWPSYVAVTRTLNRLTYRMNDAIIVVSHEAQATIPATLQNSTTVIAHGVNPSTLVTSAEERVLYREELLVDPSKVLVGTVAGMRAEKGYRNLLHAAAILKSRGAPVEIVAIGTGGLEEELHQLHQELDLGGSFRFIGARKDAARVIAAFDIFVLASEHEGMPVVVMEALAQGTPIVASAVGGIPEMITDGVEGRLVASRDPEALANAIDDVARDQEFRSRASAAAVERSANFDASVFVDRIEGIYGNILGDRSIYRVA